MAASFTIVSFNAHGGVRARRGKRCEPYDLPAALRAFDADVLVVQETWTPDGGDSAARLVAAAAGIHVAEVAFGRGTIDPWPHYVHRSPGHGVAGIAVLSRLPMRVLASIPIREVSTDPAPDRAALHVELDVAGRRVELVAVHLTSRIPYGPVQQIRGLRAFLPPPGRPAVLAGDHNLWGWPVRALLPGWRRAVRGRTFPASRPHSQIDHILVRRELDVVASAVLADIGSDHRPVRAELRVQ